MINCEINSQLRIIKLTGEVVFFVDGHQTGDTRSFGITNMAIQGVCYIMQPIQPIQIISYSMGKCVNLMKCFKNCMVISMVCPFNLDSQ